MKTRVRKAVIPVAGEGTRMLPATKSVAKELLTVVDRPVIQYVVDEAMAAGIEHIVFVTGRGKSAIEDHFDRRRDLEQSLAAKGKTRELALLKCSSLAPGAASFTRQQEPAGLGHAIWCARALIGDEPFAVLLPDVISAARPAGAMRQMMDAHADVGGNLIATERVPEQEAHKYGIVDIGSAAGRVSRIRDMVEKPPAGTAPSNLMIMGRYILEPAIFDILSRGVRGAGGEIQLTDAMRTLSETRVFHALELSGKSFDCGSPLGLFEANLAFALEHPESHQAALDIICDRWAGRSAAALRQAVLQNSVAPSGHSPLDKVA